MWSDWTQNRARCSAGELICSPRGPAVRTADGMMGEVMLRARELPSSWRMLAKTVVLFAVAASAGAVPLACPPAGCCPAGTAGPRCEFSLRTLFFEQADSIYNWTTASSHLLRPYDNQGWNVQASIYHQLAVQVNAQFIVEVGVWKGGTTLIFAQWLKQHGRGVIMSVDTWLGALEFWTRGPSHGAIDMSRNLHIRHGFPTVYYTFLSNVVHANVTDYVIPFPVPSRLASDYAFQKHILADLIHIDAAHEYDDVKEDIRLWWRNLRPGGILVGDDYQHGWPGVMRAVDEYANMTRLMLTTANMKWWFIKPLV